jgi:phosphoribosyl 1,2-cyclic phosphodiesterase
LEFGTLASGSTGNAMWLADGDALLIDCGLSVRALTRRAHEAGLDLERVRGLVLTHEHSDHAAGAVRLASHLGIPILASPGTLMGLGDLKGARAMALPLDAPLDFEGFRLEAFDVHHDSQQPVGLTVEHQGHRLGLVTDTGRWDARMAQRLGDLDVLLLESNHDEDLLHAGVYPANLKQRIHGPHGHLSNDECARLVAEVMTPRLKRLVLTHISQQNNTPELALATVHNLVERLRGQAPAMHAAPANQALGPFAF